MRIREAVEKFQKAREAQREASRRDSGIQTHAEWRAEHPTEHPLWCQYAVTGKLQPCDCDLSCLSS